MFIRKLCLLGCNKQLTVDFRFILIIRVIELDESGLFILILKSVLLHIKFIMQYPIRVPSLNRATLAVGVKA